MAEMKDKEREINRLSSELSSIKAQSLSSSAKDVAGVKLIATLVTDMPSDDLRSMCEALRDTSEDAVIVIADKNTEKGNISFACGCAKGAIAKGMNAGNIVREVAKLAGGSGGGRPDFAMAGGKDITKAEEAVSGVEAIVSSMAK